jgi:hypothetical protein
MKFNEDYYKLFLSVVLGSFVVHSIMIENKPRLVKLGLHAHHPLVYYKSTITF